MAKERNIELEEIIHVSFHRQKQFSPWIMGAGVEHKPNKGTIEVHLWIGPQGYWDLNNLFRLDMEFKDTLLISEIVTNTIKRAESDMNELERKI